MKSKIAKVIAAWGGHSVTAEVNENYDPPMLDLTINGVKSARLTHEEWLELVSEVQRIWPIE